MEFPCSKKYTRRVPDIRRKKVKEMTTEVFVLNESFSYLPVNVHLILLTMFLPRSPITAKLIPPAMIRADMTKTMAGFEWNCSRLSEKRAKPALQNADTA